MVHKLKEIINSQLTQIGIRARVQENLALQAWSEVAGPKLAKITAASYVNEGVLFVTVASPAWAQELTYLKGDLLARIRRYLGSEAIRDIRFQIGSPGAKSNPGQRGETETDAEYEADWEKISLEPETLARMAAWAELVHDEALQTVFRKWLALDYRDKQRKMGAGWKACPVCQTVHNAATTECHFCAARSGASRDGFIRRLLRELPGINLEALQGIVPDLGAAEFARLTQEADRLTTERTGKE